LFEASSSPPNTPFHTHIHPLHSHIGPSDTCMSVTRLSGNCPTNAHCPLFGWDGHLGCPPPPLFHGSRRRALRILVSLSHFMRQHSGETLNQDIWFLELNLSIPLSKPSRSRRIFWLPVRLDTRSGRSFYICGNTVARPRHIKQISHFFLC
jgi:hypothetical protein